MIVEKVVSYLFGYISGFGTAAFLMLYFLSLKAPLSNNVHRVEMPKRRFNREDYPTDESRKMLDDAMRHLINLQVGKNDIQHSENEDIQDMPNMTLYQLEQNFQHLCKSSKDRAKQTKNLAAFVSDIGRVFAAFGKELMRLSNNARSNVKSEDAIATETTTNVKSGVVDKNSYFNDWWVALSLCMEHLSNDSEKLSEQMSREFSTKIIEAQDDQRSEDKTLFSEGMGLLNDLKLSLMNNEPLVQERDKWRNKVSSALQVPSNVPVIGGMTLPQSDEESSRRVTKLQICELALLESTKKVNDCKNEFKFLMPKIFSSFRATGALSFVRTKMQIMSLADSIEVCNENSKTVIQRLKSHISDSYSTPSSAKGSKKSSLLGFESTLQTALANLSHEGLQKKYVRNDGSQFPSTFFPGDSLLNMKLESTACLAASASIALPPLPQSFRKCIGQETCVWFNAFSGRVYRDAAKSEHFHDWLLAKLTTQLNKGARPGFVDEFTVESVSFGATPPLLFNVRWSPTTVPPTHTDENDANAPPPPCSNIGNSSSSSSSRERERDRGISVNYSSRSGSELGSASFSTKDDCNISSAHTTRPEKQFRFSDRQMPTHNTPNSSPSRIHDSPNGRSKIFHNGNEDNVGSNNNNNSNRCPDENEINNKYDRNIFPTDKIPKETQENSKTSPGSDSADEDVECTADIAFRSGLKFKISTRLWCNWPMDHCASVPVSLTLELVDLSGKIRFGMTHSNSFISFLEEPKTRFAVHSEVGSDAFKLKDIPTLTDYIVKKLRSEIVKKIVHPNVHKFRLLSPRNWWPEDVKEKFGGSACSSPAKSSDSKPLSAEGRVSSITSVNSGACNTAVPHSAANGISNSGAGGMGDMSVPVSTFPVTGDADGSSRLEFSSARSAYDRGLSPDTLSVSVSEISLPAVAPGIDAEETLSKSQSAAAAVLASFSSTTDWIRSEVRGFKISAGPFKSSTPPLQQLDIAQEHAERNECREDGQDRPWGAKDVDFKEGSCADKPEENNLSNEHNIAVVTSNKGGSLPTSPQCTKSQNSDDDCSTSFAHEYKEKLSEIEIRTIKACEEMNLLTAQRLKEKEKEFEKECNEVENEGSPKKWYEKLNTVTESISMKFMDKEKNTPDIRSPPPLFPSNLGIGSMVRSRSTSASGAALTAVLSDLFTPVSEVLRRNSYTTHSSSSEKEKVGTLPHISPTRHEHDSTSASTSFADSTTYTDGNIESTKKSNATRFSLQNPDSVNASKLHTDRHNSMDSESSIDDYGIAECGAVCLDNSQSRSTSTLDADQDMTKRNLSDSFFQSASQSPKRADHKSDVKRKFNKVNFLDDPVHIQCENESDKEVKYEAKLKEIGEENIISENIENIQSLKTQEKRYFEFRMQQRRKMILMKNMTDSILQKVLDTPCSPLLCSLSISPPYSPHRIKEYLVPDTARMIDGRVISAEISSDCLLACVNDKSINTYDNGNNSSISHNNDSIDRDAFHRDFEEKYRKQSEDVNRDDNHDCDEGEGEGEEDEDGENLLHIFDDEEDCVSTGGCSVEVEGRHSAHIPVFVGTLRCIAVSSTNDEIWVELCYEDDGARLKLYSIKHTSCAAECIDSTNDVIHANDGLNDTQSVLRNNMNYSFLHGPGGMLDHVRLKDEGVDSVTLTLIASIHLADVQCRAVSLLGERGLRSTLSSGLIGEKINGGRADSTCTSPDRKTENIVECSNGVNTSTPEKPWDGTGVAVSADVNDFKDCIGQSVDMSDEREEALSVMFGFEIYVTKKEEKNRSEDVLTVDVVNGVNQGIASGVLDSARSKTCGGVTWAADNVVAAISSDVNHINMKYGAIIGSKKDSDTNSDDMKKCSENGQNKREWITFWCDSESECAGWLSSLQLSSHAYYDGSQNM